MRRVALIVAIVLTLAAIAWLAATLPASGRSMRWHHHHVVVTDPISLAYRAAVRYWTGAPCGGRVRLAVTVTPKWVPDEAWSWAEHGPSLLDPSQWVDCVASFNSEYWWSWREIDEHYEDFCVAMIHELGNLRGEPETREEVETRNVMDELLNEIVPPPECTHYALVRGNGHVERKAWTP